MEACLSKSVQVLQGPSGSHSSNEKKNLCISHTIGMNLQVLACSRERKPTYSTGRPSTTTTASGNSLTSLALSESIYHCILALLTDQLADDWGPTQKIVPDIRRVL